MDLEAKSNMNEKLVVLLAIQGDESAFRELYETNYERIYRLAWRYSKSQQDAEDIMQETFVKAFKSIKKFDFNISTSFSAWIYQIGINCSIDHFRKRKKRKADRTDSLTDSYREPEDPDTSPEKTVIAKQAISQVNDALDILTPKQRMIFDLRHLQHKALKEISDHLQCSQSTVKTQLQRAVTKLRNRLEPLWREE